MLCLALSFHVSFVLCHVSCHDVILCLVSCHIMCHVELCHVMVHAHKNIACMHATLCAWVMYIASMNASLHALVKFCAHRGLACSPDSIATLICQI